MLLHIPYFQYFESFVFSLGMYFQANHVISAIPVSLLNRITFDPPLSGERYQMMQRIPMGCIIKTIMFYETAFWRDMGMTIYDGPHFDALKIFS